jgi:hypothetical protein
MTVGFEPGDLVECEFGPERDDQPIIIDLL